jgi:hypothetical protein
MGWLAPAPAVAQTAKSRGTVYANGGYQTGTESMTVTGTIVANADTGSFTSTFKPKSGTSIDVGGSARVWKALSVGVAYTTFSADGQPDVSAEIPHPFFFNQPRSVSGQVGVSRSEKAFHIRAVFTSAPGKKIQFSAFGGPVVFSVTQDVVTGVSYSDAYPYDSATFASASTKQVSQSKTGFGGGADVAYYFTDHIGLGASATLAKATITTAQSDGTSLSIKVGGAIVGIGLRVRF